MSQYAKDHLDLVLDEIARGFTSQGLMAPVTADTLITLAKANVPTEVLTLRQAGHTNIQISAHFRAAVDRTKEKTPALQLGALLAQAVWASLEEV